MPQLYKNYKNKNAEAISLPKYIGLRGCQN